MKKLYRSRANKMIAGVCGGIAAYLNVDATIVRLAFVLISFMSGFGIILYIILWIIVPLEGTALPPLTHDHFTQVGTEMKDTVEGVAKEVKKTVTGLKKKPPTNNSSSHL